MPAPQPTPPAASKDPVLEALNGAIPPSPTPIHYTLGLFFVAAAMILLPLVYLSMIGLASYGWYHYAANVFGGRGKMGFWDLVLLFTLAIVILFMIKPFLAGASKSREPKLLHPNNEPRLFEFVRRICKMVGAPMPSEIRVDCEVNASVGFGHGMLGVFSRRLVLTIGMPLAAGLNIRQFAGVLAHEMGHFSQRVGMRLSYVIRSINLWFLRIVAERDVWDLRMDDWGRNEYLGIVLWPARMLIKLNRMILYVFMLTGNAISCFLSRQMEYDADRYDAHLAGSHGFELTSKRIRELSIAWFGAQYDLQEFWEEGRLPDNLPVLIVRNAGKIPHQVMKAYDKHQQFQKTGVFDTHPTDQDRIASVRGLDTPGLFQPELAPAKEAPREPSKPAPDASTGAKQKRPAGAFVFDSAPVQPRRKTLVNPFGFDAPPVAGASVPPPPKPPPPPAPPRMVSPADQPAIELFRDFELLAKAVSYEYYRTVMGRKIHAAKLNPIDDLVKRQEGEQEGEKALLRFFQTPLVDIRPLHLAIEKLQPVKNPQGAVQAVRDSRDEMLKAVPGHAFARMRYLSCAEKLNHQR